MTPPHATTAPRRLHRWTAALITVVLALATLGLGSAATATDTVPTPEATQTEPVTEPTVEPSAEPEPAEEPAVEPTPAPEPTVEPSDEPSQAPERAAEPVEEPAGTERADTDRAHPAAAAGVVTADIAHTGTRHDGPGGIVYYVPDQIAVGEPIRISGTGWTTTSGDAGSVIGVKLDEGGVSTTLEVTNPATGAVQANKTIVGIAQADATGAWEISVPFPTLANSNQAWAAGQTHSVRLLTGSLVTGDVVRTQTASFAVADAAPTPSEPPAWPHQTVTYTDPATGGVATAWIESAVAAGDVSAIRVKGSGWVDAAGTRGSTVALKLNSGVGTQYTRTGADIVQHPTASGDDTIWALLAKADGTDRPHVFPIDDTGSFEITVDAPTGLLTGQYLTAQLQSGRFLAGDVQRTVVGAPIVVGGVPWVDDADDAEVTCVPSSPAPTVRIESSSVSVGGTLHVTGTGWCHPAARGGGSIIAFKIDEGAYSRLTTSVHQNRTIWAVAAADAATGDFDTQIQLPDGTTAGANGSDPAFATGAHSLRLLSGSLKAGDTVRTLESAEFVVGTYQPNGLPPLLESREDLTSATKGGLSLTRTASAVTVTVPGAVKDDWVFLTTYASDGSPRYPWGATWFRADGQGRVVAPLAGATLPVGTSKLTAQSGNRGDVGRLLGWDHLTVAAPADDSDGGDSDSDEDDGASPGRSTPAVVPVVSAPPAVVAPAPGVPLGVPAAPFPDASGFTADNAGGVTGAQDGTVVTITIPSAAPGDWVYLYAYSTPLGVGWIQVDAQQQVAVDVAQLPSGVHHLAVLDRNGGLIGWTTATVDPKETDIVPQVAAITPVLSRAVPAASGRDWMTDTDWWLLAAGLVVLLAGCGSAVAVRRTHPAAEGRGL
ncbi:MAG: hypothetical protein ABWX74_19330 [Aeromicrobium sp.]